MLQVTKSKKNEFMHNFTIHFSNLRTRTLLLKKNTSEMKT